MVREMFTNLNEVSRKQDRNIYMLHNPNFVKQLMKRIMINRIHKALMTTISEKTQNLHAGRQNCDLESNKTGSTTQLPCDEQPSFKPER